MDIREYMKERILFFDGAMGTMLEAYGYGGGELPELACLSNPDMVTGIHKEYVDAGADVVTANTFQGHELKVGGRVEEVVGAAVRCAKASGTKYTALDVGPLGQLIEPLGPLSFQRAYDIYARQMKAGAEAGADLILIETISDLYEAKAAVLAAKENTSLPVFCTMTFGENGRTFMGCDPVTATVVLQGLGVDALGVNCSLGPELLRPVAEAMLRHSRVPVLLQANAGLPVMRDGKPCYDVTPEAYADVAAGLVEMGLVAVGGCCGTNPAFIKEMKNRFGGRGPVVRNRVIVTACASGTGTVVLDNAVVEIGERLNPTGKPEMQEALRDGDFDYLIEEASGQIDAGAQILDINVAVPGLDEPGLMAQAVREIQGAVRVPLCIDSADPAVIEAGVRVANGKPIVNSITGEKTVMDRVFPIVKKYGALVIGLALDEKGIPPTAEGRLAIARRIVEAAEGYDIPKEDIIIDCLALPASPGQAPASETLAAIRLVKRELNVKTVLGISNVSFGLPGRELLNAAFLGCAIGAGLDAAIMNPLSERCREVLDAARVFSGGDENAAGFAAKYRGS